MSDKTMSDKEYICKAVDLSDDFIIGWDDEGEYIELYCAPLGIYFDDMNDSDQWILDALAAQLVRQVDALPEIYVLKGNGTVCIMREFGYYENKDKVLNCVDGEDTSMNTIKVIVDSKVLEAK